jgi:hypothetical protein
VRTLNLVADRLLATLPDSILNAIEPHFTTVTFAAGTIVHQPDDEVHHLYFPSDGFVSLQIVAGTGTFIDTAWLRGMVRWDLRRASGDTRPRCVPLLDRRSSP